MSLYQRLNSIGSKFISYPSLLKWGFNLSPMYRRSTARILTVTKDLHKITIRIKLSYKNKNYMGTMFGGSMFSAVDPIPMVQLIHLLGNKFVVWDKSAEILFKRPGNENMYADFEFSEEEILEIKTNVSRENEVLIIKKTSLTNQNKTKVFCEVNKTIYIANKEFYQAKKKVREQNEIMKND